ncbi:MAG: Sec-independent protein translocase TatA [Candidatus Cloacimonas sp. 4484_209]|nr:MAG: Sec-independent protein translocase TatA [Candidatus Cloacimonas sp. 4484_209]
MFGGAVGWQEIILILLVILLLFGAKKIPELMHSLGKGIKEFKKSMEEIQSDIKGTEKGEDEKSE